MKNCTRVWRNIRNIASAKHERYYEYFAKHKCNFSLILREQVQFPFNIIFNDKEIYFEKIVFLVSVRRRAVLAIPRHLTQA